MNRGQTSSFQAKRFRGITNNRKRADGLVLISARVDPNMHRDIVDLARRRDKTINRLIIDLLDQELEWDLTR